MRLKLVAVSLIIAIWLMPLVVFAQHQQTSAGQAQNPEQTSQKPEVQKTQDLLGQPPVMAPKPTPTPAATKPQKPLSVDEDPSMIGKRNINKGIWAGGPVGAKGIETEKRLGQQLAAEVDKEAKFITDPVMTEYVNRVAQNIVLHSDAKVPFTVKIIDSDEVNAFALPGGFFYVNKGLILAADNEAELAGVMAHEIAHVCARHAMENYAKMRAVNIGILAGILLGGGILSPVLNNGGGFFENLAFLKFSRSAEEEADRLGAQYAYAAGYDPMGLPTMFEKLEAQNKKKPGSVAKLFMDHPAPAERRAKVVNLISRFPEREEYLISSSEFQKVKTKLLALSNRAILGKDAVDMPNNTEPSKPVLRKRAPVPDDDTTTSGTKPPDNPDQPKDQAPKPPTLKKKDPQSEPSPTPSLL